jgi:hypothetical protein
MTPWNEIREHMMTSTIQRTLRITNDDNNKLQDAVLKQFGISPTQKEKADMTNIPSGVKHKYDDIGNLLNDIRSQPLDTMQQIKRPYMRWMVLAIIIFSLLFKKSSLNYYSSKLRETVYDFSKQQWHTPRMVESKIKLKQSLDNMSFSKKFINYELLRVQAPESFTINTMKELSTSAERVNELNRLELDESQKAIDELKGKHMKHLQLELRPPEFPKALWPYVFDSEKPNVGKRFDILRQEVAHDTLQAMNNRTTESPPIDVTKVPKNRLEEVLERLLKIDIST